jgi:hypothetical protein
MTRGLPCEMALTLNWNPACVSDLCNVQMLERFTVLFRQPKLRTLLLALLAGCE